MQQYIVSDGGPTERIGKTPGPRHGAGLTTKIVVSGALAMLMLVATLLAAGF